MSLVAGSRCSEPGSVGKKNVECRARGLRGELNRGEEEASKRRCPPIGIGNNLGREVKEGETCAKEG